MEEGRQRRPMNRFERAAESVAKSKAGGWYFINIANRVDRLLLPLTKGRMSLSGQIVPIGLLKTVGAKSGKERHTPLTYLPDGERVVLTASKGGSPRHPSWFHNLRANPDVRFLARGAEKAYRARVAEGAERERLWAGVNDLYAGYETYQGRTGGRRIPVVVLEPNER
jgi:deazaflavin-dependent oxidoreductase (nitroreductase family)